MSNDTTKYPCQTQRAVAPLKNVVKSSFLNCQQKISGGTFYEIHVYIKNLRPQPQPLPLSISTSKFGKGKGVLKRG